MADGLLETRREQFIFDSNRLISEEYLKLEQQVLDRLGYTRVEVLNLFGSQKDNILPPEEMLKAGVNPAALKNGSIDAAVAALSMLVDIALKISYPIDACNVQIAQMWYDNQNS